MNIGKVGKDKKPKFLLDFQVKELVNIPQSSGYCYIRWNLKDGTGTSDQTIMGADGKAKAVSTAHKGTTNKVAIKRHRAQWNYKLEKPMHLKLIVDKHRKFIPKVLYLEVYFEFPDGKGNGVSNGHSAGSKHNRESSTSSMHRGAEGDKKESVNGENGSTKHHSMKEALDNTFDMRRFSLDSSVQSLKLHPSLTSMANNININSSYSQKASGKILLGTVKINVAEYVREDESPITNRFLLSDSKVNSILNVTLKMRMTRGNYHDFKIPEGFSSGQLSTNFRGELSGLLDSNDMSPSGSPNPSGLFSNNGSGNSGNGTSFMSGGGKSRITNTISASMSPLVDTLYQKTFQLPWDPRPGEFSPRECVDDILHGGSGWARNEKGVNLIDIEALKIQEIEDEYYSNKNVQKKDAVNKSAYHVKDGHTCEKKMQNSMQDFSNMDKREFMEKKREWNHLSPSQREKLRTEKESISKDESPENFIIDGMKDSKSWSIKQPVF
ncbi:hypothetical protein RNJ44_00706 [Nakaseomyces bracarensis]|uniref:C2 NT-type domain-containing protein n=1 Tax=Nakaseomyces bracarensis TaxID=273131 RepID=A0ABR4NRV8_9SACH